MTTRTQIKKAVQPLLDRHGDLVFANSWVIAKPVRHIVRAVLIDRTRDKDSFRPWWFVRHLFSVQHSLPMGWGRELYPPFKGIWRWSRAQAIGELLDLVEEQALPRLRAVNTIADVIEQMPDLWLNTFGWREPPLTCKPHIKIYFDVALGDLDAARRLCVENAAIWTEERFGVDRTEDDRAEARRLKELCRRIAMDDRAGLAALLHEWEATTVRNLRIEHLWQPTPFPLEEISRC